MWSAYLLGDVELQKCTVFSSFFVTRYPSVLQYLEKHFLTVPLFVKRGDLIK